MTADCLAPTGASVPWLLVIGALVLIGLATVLFLTDRKRKNRMLALSAVVAIGLVTVASLGAPVPAQANTVDDCVVTEPVVPPTATPVPTATPEPTATPTATPTPTPTPTPQLESPEVPDIVMRDATFLPESFVLTFDVGALDLTSPHEGATIDWSTFDLDPSTPGIQQQVTLPAPEGNPTLLGTLTFDPETLTLTAEQAYQSDTQWVIDYQVADTLGQLSNISTITADIGA